MLQKTKEIFNEYLRRKIGLQIKQAYPREFDKFLIQKFDKELEGIEIGVYRAEHAEYMLKVLPIKKLFLIDNYEYYGCDFRVGYDMRNAKKIMKKRLKKYEDKYKFIEESSDEAWKNFKSKRFDFIYVDGDHIYEQVKKDLENYYPLLKEGGLFGGDDFVNTFGRSKYGVIQAVMEFVAKHNLKLFIGVTDWWVIKKVVKGI